MPAGQTSTGRSSPQSWTGGSGDSRPVVRHRWEANWTEIQDKQFLAPMRRLRRRVVTLLLFAVVLAAIFVWCLLFAPIKTPLLAVTVTDYRWPLPPLAFAQEDRLGLMQDLNGKTIDLIDGSSAWQSKQRGLEDLNRRLKQLVERGARSHVIILYFSIHGAVDENGIAYLVPSDAGPLSPSSWLSVDELLDNIEKDVPSDLPTLLVFDCVRQPTNWDAAVLYNTFPRRLGETVSRRGLKNVAAISSTSDGEVGWASPDIRASTFGREFKLGLAGAADAPIRDGKETGGNGDGQVTVHELFRYLSHRVPQWTLANRATMQTPQLSPENAADFRVAWSLNNWQLGRLKRQDATLARAADAVQPESIAKLWQRLDRLRSEARFQDDPLAWADLEHRLLWLEDIATSGAAYTESSARAFEALEERFDKIESEGNSRGRRFDMFGRVAAMSDRSIGRPPRIQAHSLAWDEVFGQVDATEAASLRTKLLEIGDGTNRETVAEMLDSFDNGRSFENLTETNFVRLVRRYDLTRVWPNSDVVRKTIEIRDRAERLAAQGDERTHYWIQPWLDRADHQRRIAEDLLFAGPQANADSAWDNAQAALDAIEPNPDTMRGKIESAILLRDQVWSETPYLARWLCSPLVDSRGLRTAAATSSDASSESAAALPPTDGQSDAEQSVNLQLLPLIRDAHDLGDQIANRATPPSLEPPAFLDAAARLRQKRDSLQKMLRDRWSNLLKDEQQDAETVREIEAVLIVPSLPWDKRLALRQKHASLSTFLASAFVAKPSDESQDASTKETTETTDATMSELSYLDRLQAWNSHPLGAILRIESASEQEAATDTANGSPPPAATVGGSTIESIESRIGDIRDHLTGLSSVDASTLDEWSKSGKLAIQLPAPQDPRAYYSLTERLVRSAAPIWFPRPASSPIDRVRRFDLQQQLLWYARRTIDDFYADGAASGSSSESRNSFFDVAARDLLESAQALLEPSEPVQEQIRKLDELRRARVAMARNLLVTSGGAATQGNDAEVNFLIWLRPGKLRSSSNAVSAPQGAAALFLRGSSGPLDGARVSVEVPLPEEGVQQAVSSTVSNETRDLQAVALFRGHEFATSLVMRGRGGVTVQYVPSRQNSSEVTLFGDRREQSSIMFVLDCSWSMRDPIAVEEIGSETQPRLGVAKSALLNMLRKLAERQDTRVGVRFFGHRLGWTRPVDPVTGDVTGQTRIAIQPKYTGDIPDELVPSEDVELILPLGRFDARQADAVAAKLATVEPWGQSPLYLALVESLNDFALDDPNTSKSIVVITDGDNFQFTAGNRAGGSTTSLAEVQRASQSSQVPIYILGFGVPDAEAASAKATFVKLASESGGEFHDVNSGAELLRTLMSRLSQGGYVVDDPSGRAILRNPDDRVSARLNSPVMINPVVANGAYSLRFQSVEKAFELQGGEALEMFVTSDGRDIVSRPFDREFPVTARLTQAGAPESMIARVHRTTYQSQIASIPVSIQGESHYTRRPDEVWIEVTPMRGASARPDHTYIYYDAPYVANKPVPYFRCLAAGWPDDADQAAVRIWCKYERTLPLLSIKMSDVAADPTAYSKFRDLAGATGARYHIETTDNTADSGEWEVRIVEEHSEDSLGVGSLRVQLETPPNLTPIRVNREFNHISGTASHSYFFALDIGRQVVKSPAASVVFTTRAAAQDGAWHLPGDRSIMAEIFSAAESLPLDAATSVR